jgi:hypothetical protein
MRISPLTFALLSLAIASRSASAQELYIANYATSPTNGSAAIYKVTFSSPGVFGAITPFVAEGMGINEPMGMAFDAFGNLYVANQRSNTIHKVTSAGVVSTLTAGMNFPIGLAFDPTGNLYVANRDSNAISKITFTAPGVFGAVSTFASGIGRPAGLTFDTAGNLYATSLTSSNIQKLTFSSPGILGTTSVYATGILSAIDLAFDASGNLYTTFSNNNVIKKITPDGVVTNFSSRVIDTPYGLEADSFGNFYATGFNGNAIEKVSSTGVVTTLVSLTARPSGIAYKPALSGASAPEPGTLALLSLGGTLVLIRRRRGTLQ